MSVYSIIITAILAVAVMFRILDLLEATKLKMIQGKIIKELENKLAAAIEMSKIKDGRIRKMRREIEKFEEKKSETVHTRRFEKFK